MTAKGAIHEALDREVRKLIQRHNLAAAGATLNRRRYEKRSGKTGAPAAANVPLHWTSHPHFSPYYVRSRIESISHAIAQKVHSSSYKPNPSVLIGILKPGGGVRDISISTVPDAAVSYWLGKRLIERNSYRFSSYTYAYRADRNAHHAIEHLMTGIRGKARLFALEYDFAKYFDSIKHDYLTAILRDRFLVSEREHTLLSAFLTNPRARSAANYKAGIFEIPTVGIPQGSNVSLFLANVACWELDREIEQVGVAFARYADDTLVVCDTYEKADACAKLLLSHGGRSGTSVNFSKSPGISLLTPDINAEFKRAPSVVYLSHSLSPDGVGIAAKSIARIKRRAAKIIYNNLLLQPKRGDINPERVGLGFHDWDLVTCVNELRRYIYGRITEGDLSKALSNCGKVNTTLCAMSFYPTVDEFGAPAIRSLDGWLVDTLVRAYAKRCQILASLGLKSQNIQAGHVISGEWYDFPAIKVETRLPSFYRAWLYVRKAAKVYGLEKFPSPGYEYL